MRRRLQALACLGCLAATSIPASSPAAAHTASSAACRVVAAKPVSTLDHAGGTIASRSELLSCPGHAKAGAGASAVESAVVRLTNRARARNGCRPLVHDRKLRKAAERHSADMAAKDYFDHTGRDGRSAGDRIRAAGFTPIRAWGENIAMGQRSASQVVHGWLDSPGHRRNIMNCSYTHIGVGHHARGPHWTQVFARH